VEFQHAGTAMGIPMEGIEGQQKSMEMRLLTNRTIPDSGSKSAGDITANALVLPEDSEDLI